MFQDDISSSHFILMEHGESAQCNVMIFVVIISKKAWVANFYVMRPLDEVVKQHIPSLVLLSHLINVMLKLKRNSPDISLASQVRRAVAVGPGFGGVSFI